MIGHGSSQYTQIERRNYIALRRHAELADRVNHVRLKLRAQVVVEGEADQSVADRLGDRAIAKHPSVALSHGRTVQRDVMKHSQDTAGLQMRYQRLPGFERGHEQVEHVELLLAPWRNPREGDTLFAGPAVEALCITAPDPGTGRRDPFPLLQLGVQECSQAIRNHVAGAGVHPGVLVDLTTVKRATVGSFFTENFGPLDQGGLVDQQGAALAAIDVLGFVNALRGEAAERAKQLSLVTPEQAVGIVLDDSDAVPGRNRKDGIHGAADSGVVYNNNGSCPRRDQAFE